MLTVHHLQMSQSDRVVWLCEELELDYELVLHQRDPETRMAPASYRALHPAGTAPIIRDGDVVLAESGAIVEWLIEKHGRGRLKLTADQPEFADYLFWFHFANSSLMPRAMMELVARMTVGETGGTMLSQRTDAAFAMLEARLAAVPFLAGPDFTAADIMSVFPLTTMRVFLPRDLSGYPAIRAYLGRIGARPAYARAMAKADPDLPLLLS